MQQATGYRRPARRPSRAVRNARRRAIFLVVGIAFLVVLALAAFRPEGRAVGSGAPASPTLLLAPPPDNLVIASAGGLQISVPVNERVVTAIGYHGGGDDAVALDPAGRQANEGLFARTFHRIFGGGSGGVAYYQLSRGVGPSTSALDVGAPVGTDVYSPIDGTIVGLREYVVNGKQYGSVIDVQPANEPSLVLSISRIAADPALTVGSPLEQSTSKIGAIIDFSGVEDIQLARYTRDAGNHVELKLRSQAAASLR